MESATRARQIPSAAWADPYAGRVADRPLTLMAVHAHPDDEATGTGGVLAKYAAEGVQTVLVTCTDGGCGDGPGGVKPGETGHDPVQVVAMRRVELEASCAVLKVSHLELLGYADSGMMGWVTNDAPNSFWKTPVDEAATRLAALIEHYQPDVIVTYDANGFYGHPDHIMAHRVASAAVQHAADPDYGAGEPWLVSKLYWTGVPKSVLQQGFDAMKAHIELPFGVASVDELPFGVDDAEITTVVDATGFGAQKLAALSAHRTQIAVDGPFFALSNMLGREILAVEHFRLVHGEPGAERNGEGREVDLFAGLGA
jgi:N-acetyl-1-D-myo-inositol-2-amino-2-deoxy-alpha-D-glucopyranoside deacetylase